MANKKGAKTKMKAKKRPVKAKTIVKRKAKAKVKKTVRVVKTEKKITQKKTAKKTAKKEEKNTRTVQGTANLIITYNPTHQGLAEAEVTDVFKRIKEEMKFLKSEIDGVFKLTTQKPRDVVRKLTNLCMKEPEIFRATYQYVPIDKWCKSEIKDMQNIVKNLKGGIRESERWKMMLNKRSYDMPALDVIVKLTDVVDKPKVDLEKPEKIIRVEIFGDDAGISLLKHEEVFSVPKLKK